MIQKIDSIQVEDENKSKNTIIKLRKGNKRIRNCIKVKGRKKVKINLEQHNLTTNGYPFY